jgi:ABC-type phosphate transport system substrate-binding protein
MRYELVYGLSLESVKNHTRTHILLLGITLGIFLVSGFATNISMRVYAQAQVTINGEGATFPFPLIDTWRVDYKTLNQT